MDAARLFEENHDALCRYLLRFTGDPDAAADAGPAAVGAQAQCRDALCRADR